MSGSSASACPGGTCQLFGLFGIFVQGLIGAWCIFTLIVLWRMETPRRSFLTWLGDMSKQLVGACWGHFMNIFVAIIFGEALKTDATNNECVWYLVGFMSDILIVTFLCWWLNSFLRPHIRELCGIDIGDYEGGGATGADDGGEHSIGKSQARQMPFWLMWCCQTGIWLLIMTFVKVVVSVGVYCSQGLLYTAIAACFHGLGLCHHQRAQLVASVIIVPVVGDAFQFAVQDGFLKKNEKGARQSGQYEPFQDVTKEPTVGGSEVEMAVRSKVVEDTDSSRSAATTESGSEPACC